MSRGRIPKECAQCRVDIKNVLHRYSGDRLLCWACYTGAPVSETVHRGGISYNPTTDRKRYIEIVSRYAREQ